MQCRLENRIRTFPLLAEGDTLMAANKAKYCTKAKVDCVLLRYLDGDMEGVNETRMGLIRR